jgi:hypothetical protein
VNLKCGDDQSFVLEMERDNFESKEKAYKAARQYIKAEALGQAKEGCSDDSACKGESSRRCRPTINESEYDRLIEVWEYEDALEEVHWGFTVSGTVKVQCHCLKIFLYL